MVRSPAFAAAVSLLNEDGPFSSSWPIGGVFSQNLGHALRFSPKLDHGVGGVIAVDGAAAAGLAVAGFTVVFRLADGDQQHAELRRCWNAPFERATPVRSFASYRDPGG
jgi:hypothetical protein